MTTGLPGHIGVTVAGTEIRYDNSRQNTGIDYSIDAADQSIALKKVSVKQFIRGQIVFQATVLPDMLSAILTFNREVGMDITTKVFAKLTLRVAVGCVIKLNVLKSFVFI